jgi:methylated-DNA-[protein]-cysteine S-methyltransferase
MVDGRRGEMSYLSIIDSPVGPLNLYSDGQALTGLYMGSREPTGSAVTGDSIAVLRTAMQQLDEYFAGTRRNFELTVSLQGTHFQRLVWEQLKSIRCGETCSYGQLARRLGKTGASRAVGLANGRNPVSIVIPCHRVIGADGSLTGYGGGVERKQWLLNHERQMCL